jgi:asparagine synthase (glutamine-hydrolysing)
MCGIAGRVNAGTPMDEAPLAEVAARLAHRGPDGQGVHRGPGVALVHARLAIVDLAGGAQPMTNASGSVVVTYNGEIYNHLDLRRDLEAEGFVFRTRCDTEVLVHGHERFGDRLPERLRGMFAYAAWDARARTLLLVRDRVGIKPLYYAHLRTGDLLFASEVHALLAWPDVPRARDDVALHEYLAMRYVPAPRTALLSVRKLPPGTVLRWQGGCVRLWRYWDLPLDEPPTPGVLPRVETAAELRARVDEAVRLRLMADVPLGVFLSGGVDSSIVTAAMARQQNTRVRSFAVGFEGPESELPWARDVARAIGTDHHEVTIAPHEVADELPRIIGRLDEPVADTSAVPLYFLARAARRHVKVVLSGEGGDEAFAGYVAYARQPHHEWLPALIARSPQVERGALALADRLALRGGVAARLGRQMRRATLGLERSYVGVGRAFPNMGHHAARRLAPLWQRTRGLPALRRMLYVDTHVWLPDDLLVKADKMTMAHALELRVPLLDHVLLEWAWRLPAGYLPGKQLLKLAARGRVPDAVLDRPKAGFVNPIADWLRGPLHDAARAWLLSPRAICPLGTAATRSLLDADRRHGGLADELWALVVLEKWHAEVAAPAPVPAPASPELIEEAVQ